MKFEVGDRITIEILETDENYLRPCTIKTTVRLIRDSGSGEVLHLDCPGLYLSGGLQEEVYTVSSLRVSGGDPYWFLDVETPTQDFWQQVNVT